MVVNTLFCILLVAIQASAASYFVRAGATGSNNGTSWTNAWSSLSSISWSTVSCGDTIWVAGGTYNQSLRPAKKCTSSAPLYIRRARADALEATTAAGWSTSYDSTVRQAGSSAEIAFNGDYDYIVISGRTTAGGGSNGWLLDLSTESGGCGICFNSSSSDYNTIEYMDLKGPGYINYTSDGRAIDCTPPSGSVTGNVFSHLNIWDWESGIYAVGCRAPTFEYIDMYDIGPSNWQTYHPNGIITWGSPDGIVRFSKFHKGPKGYGVGEGIFFEQSGGSTAWQIYGNVFYDLNSTGLKAIEITSAVGAIKVYNNTFVNILVGSLYTSNNPSCSGGEWKNNLNYQSSNNTCGTASNNLVATGSQVFVNFASKDFRISSTTGVGYPRNAGATLGSAFATDLLGNQRGSDGTWDVGAFEYNSGAPVPPPLQPPTTLSTVVN